jgi:hypothetical protein
MRSIRRIAVALAAIVSLAAVVPRSAEAQNPTYCYGGWQENTNMDLITLSELLILCFEGLVAVTGF